MGGRVPFSDPRCFLPVTVYGTTVLVTVCGPSSNGLQLCRYICPAGVTQVDHESAHFSRPKSLESPDMWGMCLMEKCISLVVYVRKSEGGWKKIRAIFFLVPPPPACSCLLCHIVCIGENITLQPGLTFQFLPLPLHARLLPLLLLCSQLFSPSSHSARWPSPPRQPPIAPDATL